MDTKPAVDPTAVTDSYWVWARLPTSLQTSAGTYGKWLVFRNLDRLDDTWRQIREVVESGELGAISAKSSTTAAATAGASQRQGVICVYTSEETMDEVGLKLIYIFKHDIRYKTDEATLRGVYSHKGHQKITCRTIYWNGGDPSFEKVDSGLKKVRPRKSSGKEATKEYYKKVL